MKLNKISESSGASLEITKELLNGGSPLVVKVERTEASEDGLTLVAELVVDAYKAPAGKRIMIRQAPGIYGRDSLEEVVRGTEKASKSTAGDIVCFSSSFLKNGVAYVGKATARTHDGIEGKHQVVTAMARCSQSRVTKRGPSHSLTITDGNAAKIVSSVEEVIGMLEAAEKRAWPGGDAGLIMRNKDGATVEWFTGFDRDAAFLAEEMHAQETMVGQRLEIIPAWRVPMSRDQVMREINPTKESGPISGPVTKQFEHKNTRFKQGFLPCLIVLCDEDEWAFKAKTGKKQRVVSGVQPILGRIPLLSSNLPSQVRKYGGHSNGILEVFSDADIAKAAERRAALQSSSVPSVSSADDHESNSEQQPAFRRKSLGFGRR